MSLQTWLEEYYHNQNFDEMTAEDAINCSIQKWEGLRNVALRSHELFVDRLGYISDDSGRFPIDSDTCPLCYMYAEDKECEKCPLQKLLGTRCDNMNMPYYKWIVTKDPEPMIKALNGSKELLYQLQDKAEEEAYLEESDRQECKAIIDSHKYLS